MTTDSYNAKNIDGYDANQSRGSVVKQLGQTGFNFHMNWRENDQGKRRNSRFNEGSDK